MIGGGLEKKAKTSCFALLFSHLALSLQILNEEQYVEMRLTFLFVITLFFLGCGTAPESRKLDEVDSLVFAEKYDSAYQKLMTVSPQFKNEKDMAHYELLLAQTSYLTDNTLPTDSVIDMAISYLEKSDDLEKLAEAYYFKASCLHERNENPQAIQFYKKAEDIAGQTNDLRLQYGIAEAMAKINYQSGNYNLQLNYARKALDCAQLAGNKKWMAYSYFNLSNAFQNLEMVDSLSYYAKKLIPRLDDIDRQDIPHFLNSIGLMYFKNGDLSRAKKYYEESLSHQEVASTLVNLADVYVREGNKEKAYRLWQKASLLDDGGQKDVIMFNMLQYDLDHKNNLEDACERMNRIYAIKDSMTSTLKDRTIQELQQKYDEESLAHLYESKLMRWMIATLILLLAVLLLVGYVRYRRYRSKLLMAKHQMLIGQYSNEIKQLNDQCQLAEHDISKYQSMIADYTVQIQQLQSSGENVDKLVAEKNRQIDDLVRRNEELEASCMNAERQKEVLRNNISDIVENASPVLNRGKILYDFILDNKPTVSWSKDDFHCFVEYYKALHIKEYEAIEKEYKHLTLHNLFFLILNEMGKDSKVVSQIMGISPESIRTIKHRLQKNRA